MSMLNDAATMRNNYELPEINTWRLFNKNIDQDKIAWMVEAWEAAGYRFGSVCIDDGWTERGLLGDWMPDEKRFPDFKGLVDWIHSKGYGVRLWVAPAQMHRGTKAYQKLFPDNALRSKSGEPFFYSGLGTWRVDFRTGVGRKHIAETMSRLTRDYRINAFKVDFPPIYEYDDEFYRQMGFDFTKNDAEKMTPDFYKIVHDAVKKENPQVRICCAKNLSGCGPFIDDTICGDLVGKERTPEVIADICGKLRNYASPYEITPWLEMIWGEGSDYPNDSLEWRCGFIEYMAYSINYELKIEHSFMPFAYRNERQIRVLNNLYGGRNKSYKVLCAGRRAFPVVDMLTAGVEVGSSTRFICAPEQDKNIVLHSEALKTNSLDWRCRNIFSGAEIQLRCRNEFWGGDGNWCRVEFEAQGGECYLLYHEGEADPYFHDHLKSINTKNTYS